MNKKRWTYCKTIGFTLKPGTWIQLLIITLRSYSSSTRHIIRKWSGIRCHLFSYTFTLHWLFCLLHNFVFLVVLHVSRWNSFLLRSIIDAYSQRILLIGLSLWKTLCCGSWREWRLKISTSNDLAGLIDSRMLSIYLKWWYLAVSLS